MSAIRVKNLKKSFQNNLVLRGINLELEPGELVCLIGRSGSGKSTLLRCLNGLEKMDEGCVQVGEQILEFHSAKEFHRQAQRIRQEVGFVFQEFQLFPHLTLLENVVMAPRVVQKLTLSEAQDRAHRLLARVGLSEHAAKWPSQLSGGQQQRGAIARALALQPKVMLYDEPTSALDPELVDEVLLVMKSLNQEEKMTQVVVTHEMRFAREAADRIVFLESGTVVEQASAEKIFKNPQDERTRQFLRKFL